MAEAEKSGAGGSDVGSVYRKVDAETLARLSAKRPPEKRCLYSTALTKIASTFVF